MNGLQVSGYQSIPASVFQYGDIKPELLVRTGIYISLMSTLDIVFMLTEAGEL